MTRLSRRTLLCSGGSLLAFTAGCLESAGVPQGASSGDDPDENGDDDSGAGGDEDDDGDEAEDTGDSTDVGSDALESYDAVDFDHPTYPTDPDATFLLERDRAGRWLADRGLDDDSLLEFVDETRFEDSVLVALEADAPTLCHGMVLEDVALETDDDPQLVLEAAVRDESDGMACAQQVVTVGTLVRATFADEPVTRASVSIVDSDGRRHEMGIGVDSASDAETVSDADRND